MKQVHKPEAGRGDDRSNRRTVGDGIALLAITIPAILVLYWNDALDHFLVWWFAFNGALGFYFVGRAFRRRCFGKD